MNAVFASLLAGVPRQHGKARKESTQPRGQSRLAGAESAPVAAVEEGPAKKKQKKNAGPIHAGADDGNGINLFSRSTAEEEAGATLMGQSEAPKVQTQDPLEEAAVLRKTYRIKVSGGTAGAPLRDFEELQSRFNAGKRLLQNLQENGFVIPTPIQRQAVPALLEGHQLLAIAPTGSGKTLAFFLPIIIKLKNLKRKALTATTTTTTTTTTTSADAPDETATDNHPTSTKDTPKQTKKQKKAAGSKHASNQHADVNGGAKDGVDSEAARKLWPEAVKAVVLSPTHELAGQQFRVLQRVLPGLGLKASLLTAATAAGANFSKLDVLVANPMRLEKLIEAKRVDCSQVRFLVLDEADKLFELGFLPQIDSILAACTHPDLCRALFSATLPEKVEELARSVMHDPVRVTVGERNTAANSVKQRLHFVGREAGKLVALRQLIAAGLHPPVLVFVSSKDRAHMLHKELMYDGVHVDSIHSDQPQAVRNAAVDNFRAGSTWLLVATDLVGRGMDFIGVNTVVNYDFPRSTTDYIHRVGRTGRGGRVGEAITFYTEDDGPHLRPIANILKAAGGEVPEWMLQLPKTKTKKRNKMNQKAKDISSDGKDGGSEEVPKDTTEVPKQRVKSSKSTPSGKKKVGTKNALKVKSSTLKRQAANGSTLKKKLGNKLGKHSLKSSKKAT